LNASLIHLDNPAIVLALSDPIAREAIIAALNLS